jgi:hypothetical protein
MESVYVNDRARRELGWSPWYDFRLVLDRLAAGDDPGSPLAREIGAKGYHAETTGPYILRGRSWPAIDGLILTGSTSPRRRPALMSDSRAEADQRRV